jgi:hypothetical protein
MKITDDQIAERKLAGVSATGPVVYVLTRGGLHSMFSKNQNGDIVSLSAAPHRGIATFFAEQKDPTIKWRDEFIAKSENDITDLNKNENDNYEKYRSMIWSQEQNLIKTEASDIYFVYNTQTNDIWVSDKNELKSEMKESQDVSYWVVRPIDMTAPARMANLCEELQNGEA